MTSRANCVKGTKLGVAVKYLIKMTGSVGLDGNKRAVDTQRSSFSAQGTCVGALEILEHAVSIGNEIGGHLDLGLDDRIESRTIRTGGDVSKRVIFHWSLTSPMLRAAREEARESLVGSVPVE